LFPFISGFHKLSQRAYENKLKTTYEHIVSYFHNLFQTISQVFMPVD